jgi:hypothetical protein
MTDQVVPQFEPWISRTFYNGGVQDIYRFENGYGASVVARSGSYGVELAVIQFDEMENWQITYDTVITDDVVGFLNYESLVGLLTRIAAL